MAKKTAKKTSSADNATMALAKKLGLVLSDTYVLAVKTHGYHWNVTGPLFPQLHAFFGTGYEALFEAADELAERIRALGLMPDGSMEAFLGNTAIREADARPLPAKAMVEDLLDSHQKVVQRLREVAELADEMDDVVTEDLMVQRLAAHEKTIWMLRSQLL